MGRLWNALRTMSSSHYWGSYHQERVRAVSLRDIRRAVRRHRVSQEVLAADFWLGRPERPEGGIDVGALDLF